MFRTVVPAASRSPRAEFLEAELWILITGAQWHMLPQGYPNYKTVHRRFQQWCREEVLRKVLTELANALRAEGEIDESECFIDATFASAKGGGEQTVLLKSRQRALLHRASRVRLDHASSRR
jgi:transposase